MSCSQIDTVEAIFNEAVTLAKTAGGMIRDAYNEKQVITAKEGAMDLVTETDQKVEKYIMDTIKERFPDHCFVGEESVASGMKWELTDAPTWIVDPIDGTTNFIHRFPYIAVSIAIAVKKEMEIGIVYNPILDQLYTARKGQGAFLNGNRLKVNGTDNLSEALLVSEFGSDRVQPNFRIKVENFHNVIIAARGMRSLGSAALNMCQVAAGMNDAYFEYGMHIWDIAAGYVILQEAGGVVMDPDGSPVNLCARSVLCGTTEKLCQEISSKLQHIRYPKD